MENKRRCTICKIDRELDQFVSKAGRTNLKNCLRCRTIKSQSIKKCSHGRQCKSRCSLCLSHPINQGKCSCCKKNFQPTEDKKQTCFKCRYTCPHGKNTKKECLICIKIKREKDNIMRRKHRLETNYKNEKCKHNTKRWTCKKCNDPKKITINNMLSHSKHHDIKNN